MQSLSSSSSSAFRDWNDELQELDSQEMESRFANTRQLAAVGREFLETAFTYGKIIISERSLPVAAKTIRPVAFGGVAGGEKFLHANILFKFALDTLVARGDGSKTWLYGGPDGPDHEAAIKAAGRELLGRDKYWLAWVNGLHLPLMVLIDYKGFRLIAMPLLPISSKMTLRYGSSDGGSTVHASDAQLNAMMEAACRAMNLAGHVVRGTRSGEEVTIHGPADVEGHLGFDGRYYALDFARAFAPEAPAAALDRAAAAAAAGGESASRANSLRSSDAPADLLASPRAAPRHGSGATPTTLRYLRPEFTKRYPTPLCADAFTMWDQASREQAATNRRHIVDATLHLYESVIPAYGATLQGRFDQLWRSLRPDGGVDMSPARTTSDSLDSSAGGDTPCTAWLSVLEEERALLRHSGLASPQGADRPRGSEDTYAGQMEQMLYLISSSSLHQSGLSVRHLGRVRACVSHAALRHVILVDCVARVLKRLLQDRMRTLMDQVAIPSDEPFKDLAVRFLNEVFYASTRESAQTTDFWTTRVKDQLDRRFELLLTEEERSTTHDLRHSLCMKAVFISLARKASIRLSQEASKDLLASGGNFRFGSADIVEVLSTARMPYMWYSNEGLTLLSEGSTFDKSDMHRSARRCYLSAIHSFIKCLSKSEEGGFALLCLTICYGSLAGLRPDQEGFERVWAVAESYRARLLDVWPIDVGYSAWAHLARRAAEKHPALADELREDAARHEEVAALSTTKKGGETLRGLVSRVLARDACIVFNHRYASYGTLLRRKESFVPMDPAQVEAAAAEAAAAEAAATTVL
jgi:hypothetical protein